MALLPTKADQMAARDNLLKECLRPHKGVALQLVFFSMITNLAALAMSLYMMQLFDRVLSSRSKDTLLFLTLAIMLAIMLAGLLEAVRQNVANRIGTWLSQKIGPALLLRSLEQKVVSPGARLEALRELAQVKNFVASPTMFNVVDMLWVPLYLVVVFLLHPMFGVISAIGVVALFGLTWFNERATRQPIREAQGQAAQTMQYAECLVRNSEVIDAMGMAKHTVTHWADRHFDENEATDKTQNFSSNVVALTKFVRNVVQVALLGSGTLLVLDHQLTGGAMIAGSIIAARLLAPIEASMSYWKQFVIARHSFQRLIQFFDLPMPRQSEMVLPQPKGDLSIEALTYMVPGVKGAILKAVSFAIEAGTSLAIVGPSASGKTTLSRMLVGVLKPTSGHVRLDGADTFEWMRSDFGQHVGYLPQDIELLPGTVRQNIARFRPDANDAEVIAAAKLADCHDMILQLENGYDCMLTDGGYQLSGGQRQRIGLARALFGAPRLVVLDEPNSSLDARGDAALATTIQRLKAMKVTTVIVSHRANLLQLSDKIVMLMEGRVVKFGDAREVVESMSGKKLPVAPNVKRPTAPPPQSKPVMFNQEGMGS
jgi:ATP-binding cassette subfamily C protein/ATP-binding cassette subfamily C exporter for protease/lipase